MFRSVSFFSLVVAAGIIEQCVITHSRIKTGFGIVQQCAVTNSHVLRAGSIVLERKSAHSRVKKTFCVAQKRSGACGRIVEGRVGEQRSSANGGIEIAVCISLVRGNLLPY
jgi:hypothetical protein